MFNDLSIRTVPAARLPFWETEGDRPLATVPNHEDPAAPFGVGAGDCGFGESGIGVGAKDGCLPCGYQICDCDRVANSLLNQGAALAWGALNVAPQTWPDYFHLVALEVIVVENGNNNALTRTRMSAVQAAGGFPVWTITNAAPVVGTTQFIWSDTFPPGQETPKCFPPTIIGTAGNNLALAFFGFNSVAVAVDIDIVGYGVPLTNIPPGASKCRPYYHAVPDAYRDRRGSSSPVG